MATRVKVAFCMNDDCLPKWLATPDYNPNERAAFIKAQKPFNNLLWVEEADHTKAKELLPNTTWTLEVIPPLNELT
jgi:hypothetical protein